MAVLYQRGAFASDPACVLFCSGGLLLGAISPLGAWGPARPVCGGRGEMPLSSRVSGSARATSVSGRTREGLGANGFGHARIVEIQRARILSGMFEIMCERGAGNVSVAHVVERSGVSRRTFYEIFADREDCFLAAFEQALSFARERVLPAYFSEKDWCGRIRAALVAFLSFIDDEPSIGRLLVVESLAGGPQTLERRGEAIARITSAIDAGRGEARAGLPVSLTAEGLVGGVLAVIQSRLVDRDHGPLVELSNALMGMIVLPYLGVAAARREFDRPVQVSASRERDTPLLRDPFTDTGMRLTYRTVMVLLAVAEHPRASNRLIGETAGVPDQGQMSKLLARLQRVGLISNTGLGPGLGAPNAWSLTEKGRAMREAIDTQRGSPQL